MNNTCQNCGHDESVHRSGGLCELCIPVGDSTGAYSGCQGYVALRTPLSKTEQELISDLFSAWYALSLMGWQEPTHAPKDTPLEVIELGSTGIHKATRDDMGFWVHDEIDTYPSHPVLFRKVPN